MKLMHKDIAIDKIVSRLKRNKQIIACYIFGSYLKNKKKANDVDICVITDGMKIMKMAEIASDFDAPYDISFMEKMPSYNAFEVLHTGKPLFINNKEKFTRKWLVIVRNHLEHEPMRQRIFAGVKRWMSLKTA